MADIYFKCQCGKNMAIDQRGVGFAVPCPDCGRENTVPEPDITWNCPSCGEELSAPKSMVNEIVQCVSCKTMSVVPKPGFLDILPVVSGVVARKSAELLFSAGKSAGKTASKALKAAKSTSEANSEKHKATAPKPKQSSAFLTKLAAFNENRALKRKVKKTVRVAVFLAVIAGLWIFRSDVRTFWVDNKPKVMSFLDKTNIYRSAPSEVQHAVAPETQEYSFNNESEAITAVETDSVQTREEDSVETQPGVSFEDKQAEVEKLKKELAEQRAFLALKDEKDAQRRELLVKLKALQKEAAKYANVEPVDFVALDGTVYKNVKVKKVDPDGIYIIHSAGAGKVCFKEMPQMFASRYGYDSEACQIYEQAAKDTKELEKIMAAAQENQDDPQAIPSLIHAIKTCEAAINSDRAYALLETLLSAKEQHLATDGQSVAK